MDDAPCPDAAAPAGEFGLEALLAPLPVETFLREHLERRPLVLRPGAPCRYRGLFSLADADALLSQHRLRPEGVEFVRDGAPPRGRPLFDGDQTVAANAVYDEHARGTTIILKWVHQRVPSVARFARELALRIHHDVAVNAYLTPKDARGFAAHLDGHDVFILQLEGAKHWRIYEAPLELPRWGQTAARVEPRPGGLLHDLELQPGDLLYIPRGFVHEAKTSERPSLHLTVGLFYAHWSDLIQAAIEAAADGDVELRKALPWGFLDDREGASRMRTRLKEMFLEMAERLDFEEAVGRIEGKLLSLLKPLPSCHLPQVYAAEEVGPDARVRRRPGMRCRVYRKEQSAVIQFPGGEVACPAHVLPALRFIARSPEFAVRDLPDPFTDPAVLDPLLDGLEPFHMTGSSKVTLVRRLVRAGLLCVVAPAGLGPPAGGRE